jgi:uncharacterized protein YbbC (DUF1343 family)
MNNQTVLKDTYFCKMNFISTTLFFFFLFIQYSSCQPFINPENQNTEVYDRPLIRMGAERMELFVPALKNKKVGIVTNHTAIVGAYSFEVHLVDTLLKLGILINKIFVPEHGFRGNADAGENINNSVDSKTGIPLVSLYGSNKKPSPSDLKDIDLILFDIQDVGARFYTYISTMHYVMEACAENNIPLVVLDRPNPNGFYVDGPVLKPEFKSFVGMHPIPIVHGMTVGELAKMINGEKWLQGQKECRLTVIPCENYHHNETYKLNVKPSPNLPNMTAIYLYPSLCLFEGTIVSVGRGTDKPFQIIGYPDYPVKNFEFIPKSMEGAKTPPYQDKKCFGLDLKNFERDYFVQRRSIDLSWLIGMYQKSSSKENFFNSFFDKLAGTDELKKQIVSGKSEAEIRSSWSDELQLFLEKRKKYLLYNDFY